jgi:23S rRNA pseudouridine1911/1915/1917 synthase
VYGGGKTPFEKKHARLLNGQALHAEKISFVHPKSKERLTFSCSLPDEFQALLRILAQEVEA